MDDQQPVKRESQERDRHEEILLAAEEIIARKGLADTKISEIARAAGMADSLIYQYFKGKKDILFSIAEKRIQEFLIHLNHHLQGIQDPESRLRKIIWYHLYNNDNHPAWVSLQLLECRLLREFYQTPAYSLIRTYSDMLLSILKDGINQGKFRSDINTSVIRDIIWGTLDTEAINSWLSGYKLKGTDDLEEIMNLISPMLAPQNGEDLEKPERILMEAERIFAEKGYANAKVTEIAKAARVSEGTVYEYFESKENLLLSIPISHFKSLIRDLSDEMEPMTAWSRLRQFMNMHCCLALIERDFFKVFMAHIQLNRKFYKSNTFQYFERYYSILESIVESGKREGLFCSGVNSRVFRFMFSGAFTYLAFRWFFLERGDDFQKIHEIKEVIMSLSMALYVSKNSKFA
ncbi:MAG: TetR/AcrR family transcriptional regulator [Deltaproteobacteria bacterium]|nr:TetR/AcrR family transcriptional regulator [Deltaproteobacteria bacterium]